MRRSILTIFLLWSGIVAEPAFAWRAGMLYDQNWGADVPALDASGVLPIGFVALPLTRGYVFLTLQVVEGSPCIVVTRFNADGSLNTTWLDPMVEPYAALGSAILDTPVPDIDDHGNVKARIAVSQDGTSEKIYLAAVLGSGSSMAVTRFDPDIHKVEISAVASIGFTHGFGSIEAIATAVSVGSSGNGVLVAVAGNTTETSKSTIYGAAGTSLTMSPLVSHSGTDFRINYVGSRNDGNVDVIGTEGGRARYMLVKPNSTAGIVNASQFDLTCPDGTAATSSVLDGIMPAPDDFSETESLVLGRAQCSGGSFSSIERIADIGSTPSIESVAQLGAEMNCSDAFASAPCFSYLGATGDTANGVMAFTPDAFLAHLNTSASQLRFSGDEVNAGAFGFPVILPTYLYGAASEYPYLVDMSIHSGQFGIRRIAVDRIFADGAGDFGM
jgi:hypothetical protein